jgi:chemotaxis protein CheZ
LFIKLGFIFYESWPVTEPDVESRLRRVARTGYARERAIKRLDSSVALEWDGRAMGEPRKIFRIETMVAAPPEAPGGDTSTTLAEIMRELAALRAAVTAAPYREAGGPEAHLAGDVELLAAKLRMIRSTINGVESVQGGPNAPRSSMPTVRIANELEAVMQGSEQATQKILAAAEEIDQAANNLSAALKNESDQGLAQDIRERVIAIFEACNFQDVTCQRVVKVMAALERIEQQISRILEELSRDAAPPTHGPRLNGDHGHASQADVDSLFAGRRAKSA